MNLKQKYLFYKVSAERLFQAFRLLLKILISQKFVLKFYPLPILINFFIKFLKVFF
jgi:hypothetical protein